MEEGYIMERRKEVRLEHIAEEVGVSIVTVSNALKGKKGVSEELRGVIRETAKRMGYRTEKGKQRKAYLIGVVVAERYVKAFPSFYMDVYRQAAQELTKQGGMSVLEVVNEEQEEQWYDSAIFTGAEVDGIILIGEMNRKYIRTLRKNCRVPLVCVDCYDLCQDTDYVITDNYGGMARLTELLLEAGYENLVFVGMPEASGNVMDRYLGYCREIEKRGKKPWLEKVFSLSSEETSKGAAAEEIRDRLPEQLPEVFLCESDSCAKRLMELLSREGIRVPEDVGITGFGHGYSRIQEEIKLTTYENDEKALAYICVHTLMKRLEGRKKGMGVRVVEGRVVRGDTVERIRRQKDPEETDSADSGENVRKEKREPITAKTSGRRRGSR